MPYYPPSTKINYYSNSNNADVALTTAGTWYNVDTQSTLAGTWLVLGQAVIYNPSFSGANYNAARIWDGTTVYSAGENYCRAGTSVIWETTISISAIIVLASTTTLYLSCLSGSVGSSQKVYQTHNYSQAHANQFLLIQLA